MVLDSMVVDVYFLASYSLLEVTQTNEVGARTV